MDATCSAGASSPRCIKCNADISFDKFTYNGADYCVDCMYKIATEHLDGADLHKIVTTLAASTGGMPDYAFGTLEWKAAFIMRMLPAAYTHTKITG